MAWWDGLEECIGAGPYINIFGQVKGQSPAMGVVWCKGGGTGSIS